MDHAERLADYLAGELAADEQAAFEAQLARDPALRAHLSALRRADASLARVESPEPPDGFDQRLDARLDRELPEILDAATSPTAVPSVAASSSATVSEPGTAVPVDELAERRARRTPPRWLLATSGAAAALVVIAGVGLAIRGVVAPGVGEDTAAETSITQTFGADADDAVEESMDALEQAQDGPLIVAEGRELDDLAADTLVEDTLAFGLADRGLDAAAASTARSSYLDVLAGGADAPEAERLDEPADDADAPDAADDSGAPDAADDADAPETADDPSPAAPERRTFAIDPADPRLQTRGLLTEDDLADVARCLDVVLRDSPDAIPTYAELGTRDGDEVVAIGLVTRDPATDTFQRREVWLLDRATCDVRHIVQR